MGSATKWRNLYLFLAGVLVIALIQACGRSGVPASSTLGVFEPECRLVRHAHGETCVPTNPKRVITLSVPSLGNAIALGVSPIATSVYFDDPPPYLAAHLKSTEILGKQEPPNLERILALKPDLIIGLSFSSDSIYQQLTQIAPTVVDDWKGYPSWRDHFSFVATVLGRQGTAQQIWSRYYQRIEALKNALEQRHYDPEVSFAHTCCGTIDLDLANSFNGSIMADAGLRRPILQAVPIAGGIVRLSQERVMDIDGDVLFVAADGAKAAQTITALKQNPLWQKLRAVQANRVYPVNYPTWRGGNPLAADGVIDDLFTYLIGNTALTS
jgi:iron complex transport system substrate-binding protein